MEALLSGFLLSCSLIVGLGPQNLHVVRSAQSGRFVIAVVVLSVLCDVSLVLIGSFGLGAALHVAPWAQHTVALAGGLYLWTYGYAVVMNKSNSHTENLQLKQNSFWSMIGSTLMCSLANPAALIDTIVILGTTAAILQPGSRYLFILGVLTSSLLWFSGLAFFAEKFLKKRSQRYIKNFEYFSGFTMMALALRLLWHS